jgi:hypothetical protein
MPGVEPCCPEWLECFTSLWECARVGAVVRESCQTSETSRPPSQEREVMGVNPACASRLRHGGMVRTLRPVSTRKAA